MLSKLVVEETQLDGNRGMTISQIKSFIRKAEEAGVRPDDVPVVRTNWSRSIKSMTISSENPDLMEKD